MKRKPTQQLGTRDVVLHVATRYIPTKPQQQPKPIKRGKLNHLVKSKKVPRPPAKPVMVEHKEYAKARYIGSGGRLTAFVWQDEEQLPRGEAANEE